MVMDIKLKNAIEKALEAAVVHCAMHLGDDLFEGKNPLKMSELQKLTVVIEYLDSTAN
jgi:hypothetical protein